MTLGEVEEPLDQLFAANGAFFAGEHHEMLRLREVPLGGGGDDDEVDVSALNRLPVAQHPLVAEARDADLAAEEAQRAVYFAGTDGDGGAILVVVGARLPRDKAALYRHLLYGARLLERHAQDDWQLVYCDGGSSPLSRNHFGWLREARAVLPQVFRERLRALHVLSPSFWTKVFLSFFKRHMDRDFFPRLLLYPDGPNDQLDFALAPLGFLMAVPPFVALAHARTRAEAKALARRRKEWRAAKRSAAASAAAVRWAAARPLAEEVARSRRALPVFGGLPRVLYECEAALAARAMALEGVFRVPGRALEVAEVRARFALDLDVVFAADADPHVAAAAYKAFLRDLPEPLVPFAAYAGVVAAAAPALEGGDEEARTCAAALARAVAGMPEENRATLRSVARFLALVAARHEENKMTAHNLAVVFAPNLLRPEVETPQSMVRDSAAAIQAVQVMVERCDEVFS